MNLFTDLSSSKMRLVLIRNIKCAEKMSTSAAIRFYGLIGGSLKQRARMTKKNMQRLGTQNDLVLIFFVHFHIIIFFRVVVSKANDNGLALVCHVNGSVFHKMVGRQCDFKKKKTTKLIAIRKIYICIPFTVDDFYSFVYYLRILFILIFYVWMGLACNTHWMEWKWRKESNYFTLDPPPCLMVGAFGMGHMRGLFNLLEVCFLSKTSHEACGCLLQTLSFRIMQVIGQIISEFDKEIGNRKCCVDIFLNRSYESDVVVVLFPYYIAYMESFTKVKYIPI